MKISRAGSVFLFVAISAHPVTAQIGVEKGVARHLQDGAEFDVPLTALLQHGEDLFRAVWTVQDGGGRPLNKGTGAGLSDSSSRLVFPRNFNRISAPDANSCFGCHAQPRLGGGGDIVTNVFVLGQRFDFVTFDPADTIATRGSRDELGRAVTQQSIANERATIGLFGSGFIEMLARQMSAELQAIRDSTPPGGSKLLITKGVSFGILSRCRMAAGTSARWKVFLQPASCRLLDRGAESSNPAVPSSRPCGFHSRVHQ
jgi:hypothetical protein